MELWIRSQDKEVLTKVNNLCYYTRKDVTDFISEEELNKDIQHVIWSPDGSILGYYATKERTLEILEEIQKFIEKGCKEYKSNGDYYTSKYEYSVFQMPQE